MNPIAIARASVPGGGDIGGLARAIGDEWVEALRAAGPRPATFGDNYLQVLLDDPMTSFDTAAAEAAMGDAARERFTRSLAARWRTAKDAALAARAAHAAKVVEAWGLKRREPYHDRHNERPARLLTLCSQVSRGSTGSHPRCRGERGMSPDGRCIRWC